MRNPADSASVNGCVTNLLRRVKQPWALAVLAMACWAPAWAHSPEPSAHGVAQAGDPPARGANVITAAWARPLRQVTQAWLATLSPDLRKQAIRPLNDADRTDWHYTPRSRNGVSFKQMNPAQREAARAILKQLLSADGMQKVTNIIELEVVLREMESFGLMRDPERYHLTLYGDMEKTDAAARWGLRFEGHHLSLNFSFAGDEAWSDTPSFLGINPAKVPAGLKAGRAGLRVLSREEDLARQLLESLDAAQRGKVSLGTATFGDIVTRNAATVQALESAGLHARDMSAPQQAQLRALIREYANTFAPAIAARRLQRAEQDFTNTRFAWAGATERGQPHYYRIQGTQFLIEYDASQNGGNHIHTVWRDFNGDFGRDFLKEHYQAMAGSRHGHAR